jgi:hypothetical protein
MNWARFFAVIGCLNEMTLPAVLAEFVRIVNGFTVDKESKDSYNDQLTKLILIFFFISLLSGLS